LNWLFEVRISSKSYARGQTRLEGGGHDARRLYSVSTYITVPL